MSSSGWPFLIGRGRRTGHRVLLAPDFLIAGHDHGTLEGISGHSPDVTELPSSAGRLAVRSATHQVDAQDAGTADRPRDEHGRPLRLIYGVVAKGIEPANADLPVALRAALDTYRRFLHCEEEFAVEPSSAFPLTASAEPARHSTMDSRPAGRRRPGGIAVLSVGIVLVALAATLIILLGRSAETPPPPLPPRCPTTTTTTGSPTTVLPTTDLRKATCDGNCIGDCTKR